jgi:hypothetical protein
VPIIIWKWMPARLPLPVVRRGSEVAPGKSRLQPRLQTLVRRRHVRSVENQLLLLLRTPFSVYYRDKTEHHKECPCVYSTGSIRKHKDQGG